MKGKAQPAPRGVQSPVKRLSRAECRQLVALEGVVERGVATFVEVGHALIEIRDRRLYRATHSTFEGYCRGRWRMSARHANRTIAAAEVTALLGPTGPRNVAQARELARLLPDEVEAVEAWRELRSEHGEDVTAELVRQAVEERLAREAFCREPAPPFEPAHARLHGVSPPSRLGELFELGPHRLLCGDATDEPDVLRLLGRRRAALLFTSPPYLDLRRFGDRQNLDVEHLAGFLPLFADRAELLVVNLGILRRGREVLPYWDVYIAAARAAGLKLLAWNVWDKGPGGAQPAGSGGSFFPAQHEWLLVFGRRPRQPYRLVPNASAGRLETMTRRSPDGRLKSSPPLAVRSRRPIGSVLQQSQEKANRKVGHPAPFPVGLPQAYIETLTDPCDLVLDCFAGAGSTLLACAHTGRRFAGLELEARYCDLIRARYAALGEGSRTGPGA